ncbi:MAG: hypothetical protein AAB489_05985 [Patescibacteria group bacterium]
MPRGKRTVFAMFCKVSGDRVGTVRLHRQNNRGISWKDFKTDKYCPTCRKKMETKLKEEKHSS